MAGDPPKILGFSEILRQNGPCFAAAHQAFQIGTFRQSPVFRRHFLMNIANLQKDGFHENFKNQNCFTYLL